MTHGTIAIPQFNYLELIVGAAIMLAVASSSGCTMLVFQLTHRPYSNIERHYQPCEVSLEVATGAEPARILLREQIDSADTTALALAQGIRMDAYDLRFNAGTIQILHRTPYIPQRGHQLWLELCIVNTGNETLHLSDKSFAARQQRKQGREWKPMNLFATSEITQMATERPLKDLPTDTLVIPAQSFRCHRFYFDEGISNADLTVFDFKVHGATTGADHAFRFNYRPIE
ncbi:MAG: hypothetical protein SGI88_21685 [Candidatus Hydrogenedentes bacterium]|nr:hypothetical protein [Candidatus Hydrogenedentota bacterium]